MAIATAFLFAPGTSSLVNEDKKQRSPRKHYCTQAQPIPLKHCLNNSTFSSSYSSSEFCHTAYPCLRSHTHNHGKTSSNLRYVMAYVSSSTPSPSSMSTRLYVSGLSFRTTREGLQSAFQKFGQLIEVNLVMDKLANRPRGFAFLRYKTEEEAKNAIEGMHGKFLDGRVIFVEVAKARSQIDKIQQTSRDLLH